MIRILLLLVLAGCQVECKVESREGTKREGWKSGDLTDPANPLSPISPLNPMNPLSPFYPFYGK